ncbi:MAG: FAD-binding oxidoreductase [Synergistetes bacterium]|nr:FAD-binding oxidoreductase [Synergistota bacterium]MCX8128168.1 FAD-binding oxidoreductase [Synergistota bacterium]MDW8192544.1 FAD-binding oxidoreductase [Synergistota bacterium]
MEIADVVIIGGGIQGCSLAYHLAKKGCRSIVLLERSFLAFGGTGRSAGGVRHQFGTEINCILAKYNIEAFKRLSYELEYPKGIEFEQGGYLWIAYTEKQFRQLEENVKLQNKLGISSKMLSKEDIKKLFPCLNVEGIIGGSFCDQDGHINPFHATLAYAEAAKRLGVKLYTYTGVWGIKLSGSKVEGVYTEKGFISTPVIVNCAGPWGKEIASWVGIDVPLYPERHQILVTEPVDRVLNSFVLCLDDGSYWKQTPNGNFVLGIGNPNEVKGFNMKSSWAFLEEAAKKVVRKMPLLSGIRVIRQWAGIYDITPDSQAILGPTLIEGFYLNLGWSGHGLQFAPSIGRAMAELILGEKPFIDITPFFLERFDKGKLIPEPVCI